MLLLLLLLGFVIRFDVLWDFYVSFEISLLCSLTPVLDLLDKLMKFVDCDVNNSIRAF